MAIGASTTSFLQICQNVGRVGWIHDTRSRLLVRGYMEEKPSVALGRTINFIYCVAVLSLRPLVEYI